ncbi:MAG: hypothetical protein IJD38_03695 [Clostridia bacterium]|nr:hypothetical protein [Clostridia bacterium]
MRGDLVYEKLGEIDPELIADALPDVVPLYRLGGENPPPPKKRLNLRKALVICACLLLAGLFLVGGGIALSRSLEFPWETDTDDPTAESLPSTGFDPDHPVLGEDFRIYDGLGVQLLYVGIDPAHADEITELQAILSRAVGPVESAETAPSLYMTVGDTTYAVTRGTVFDKSRKETYELADGDWERFRELVEEIVGAFPDGAMVLPVVLDYKEQELHPLDAYVCSLPVFPDSEYASLYEISEVYLRSVGAGNGYRTPAFTAVVDRDAVYRVSIPEDAPLGDYELVVRMHSDHSVGNTDLEIISRTPAVTVVAHEKESNYAFFYECEKNVFRQYEAISLTAGLINRGDDIYRWSTELSILPNVALRTVLDGETLTYPMTTGLELEWSGELYHMTYNDSSKADFWMVTPDRLPVGVYDLVLSFEGHEEVYPRVIAIVDPNAPHGFAVDYSFTPKDGMVDDSVHIVTNNGAGIFSLRITHAGDTLYRYGYDDCLRPDSVKLYRQEGGSVGESATIFYATHTEKTKALWAWENDVTRSFLYEWDWSREPIEPGSYTLQVIYRDGDGGIQLNLTLEGALTVVAP